MMNLYGLMVSILYIVIVIALSNLFAKVSKEASRKFIHIMLANWWIIAMIFFDNVWYAATLPALFIIINYLSYKYDIIKEMERDGDDKSEKTLGTVFYAISLLVMTIFNFSIWHNTFPGLVGTLVMGYGDGFAAIAGKSIKSKDYKVFGSKKTFAGSVTMFIISLIIISCAFVYLNIPYWFIKSIVIAIISTILEALSVKGTDNITVPLITMLLVWIVI